MCEESYKGKKNFLGISFTILRKFNQMDDETKSSTSNKQDPGTNEAEASSILVKFITKQEQ